MVNGVRVQTLATTSTAAPASIRLGSVSNGSSSVVEFFDAFASGYTESALVVQGSSLLRSRAIPSQTRVINSRRG
jgi:hypothetical protein